MSEACDHQFLNGICVGCNKPQKDLHYLVTYSVGAGTMEGFHCATVLACDEIDEEFEGAVVEDGDQLFRDAHMPIKQFRWWSSETEWIEIRVEDRPHNVGEIIPDLLELTWMQ